MKFGSIFFPIAGVACLLWNGHIFSTWPSTLSVLMAAMTTMIWLALFIAAYVRAER